MSGELEVEEAFTERHDGFLSADSVLCLRMRMRNGLSEWKLCVRVGGGSGGGGRGTSVSTFPTN